MPWARLTNDLGKWNIKVETPNVALSLGLPDLSLPAPSFGLAWLPDHLPLGELSLEAGDSEKKTNDEGWQGLKSHLDSLPPMQHVRDFSPPGLLDERQEPKPEGCRGKESPGE